MVHKKMTFGPCCLSVYLSPIGECPIDPEEADEELSEDQVHKQWKENYQYQKRK
jgi:hypothetical protein